jgi:hypothetical protein
MGAKLISERTRAAGASPPKVITKRPRRAPGISRRSRASCGIAGSDGIGAQLTLMGIETRAAKESGPMARLVRFSNMHASVAEIVGEPADGERASICRPMPCHRRIDEFFDGLGSYAMIGSVRDETLESG